MWPSYRLLTLLNIEHPIVLSPMSRIGTVGLAASVCAAGGLGSIGCALLSPDEAAIEITALRARTDKPFNLNFFCHPLFEPDDEIDRRWHERMLPYYAEYGLEIDFPHRHTQVTPFGDAMCVLVEETKPAVVSFHIGLPSPDFVTRIKAAGCLIMSSATTVEEAQWLELNGADIVIAQGVEAGGHRGTFLAADLIGTLPEQMTILSLVPQIVDAVKVPVIAAGGIGDGRGIAAAFALGAVGVQIGTGYLQCPESGISSPYRDALRNAKSGSAVLTNVFTGRPGRVLQNRFVREVGPVSNSAPAFPGAMFATIQLAAEAQRRGNADFIPLWAGEAAPLGRALPAKALTELLIKETMATFDMLAMAAPLNPASDMRP